MIRDDGPREEAGELEPAVAIRCAHHGNLDMLIAEASDTSGPFSFDQGPPFEFEAELTKEINRTPEVLDDDPYVVHPLERHVSHLQGNPERQRRLKGLSPGSNEKPASLSGERTSSDPDISQIPPSGPRCQQENDICIVIVLDGHECAMPRQRPNSAGATALRRFARRPAPR